MKNKLLVYYSYTGNTKKIADMIKAKTNCDVLKLEPKDAYSDDYQTVVEEEKDNSTVDKTIKLKEININLDDYDEIIIGMPVWWYRMAPPVRTFLKEYNISEKKIKAFATNAGWLGETFEELKNFCENLKTEDLLDIKFDDGSLVTDLDKINTWIEEL